KSAKELSINTTSLKGIEEVISKLIKANGFSSKEFSIRITLTRGPGGSAQLPPPIRKQFPTLLITLSEINTAKLNKLRASGVSVVTVEGSLPLPSGIKSLSYLNSVMLKSEAERRGAYEALATIKGKIFEGSSTNVFILKGKTLYTPPPLLILPGITRGVIIKVAEKMEVKVIERNFKAEDIKRSDAAFITNSVIGMLPIKSIDKKNIFTNKAASAFEDLYSKLL
ncbi:MAG: aminotransferase class IV family protein, partial [Deltaproteobacteria bacterium]|nr:aminotransferase class IV family protein [Deltaproteobacteria bacterium]